MAVELIIPEAGESITEVRIGPWRKPEGSHFALDEVTVEIETDKAAIELPSPAAGTLVKILKQEGDDAVPGDVIGLIEPGEAPARQEEPTTASAGGAETEAVTPPTATAAEPLPRVMPSARRVLGEAGLPASSAQGTGPGGRVLKQDATRAVREAQPESAPAVEAAAPPAPFGEAAAASPPPEPTRGPTEERVPMSPLRKVIARKLVQAQQQAALLTTFNEADMSAVIELRRRHSESFRERHGVKLGFMSFFVRAVVDALQAVPAVNARIEGSEIVYHKHQDIGIAVGGGRGLVVPVLRGAEAMSFAEIEQAIHDFASRAQQNRIEISELRGGTFTISNGGIYGSMLSTPIVNPPQSGILGMHAIQDRPVALDGEVVIRPMMYLALTYDHRIIDGREAVTFLTRIKDLGESPERIWLQL
ncbi:MAG: 2-oxoglutarate dehydrogenase complex dihydrolipoyllysine-residue succinyltransferase [Acidobacteriia bacterium]|nr:2-oxoglutarate dehydrogenase complex dihydrolipoyllysine-residue succinyltransferase [Terriglobia bacterium]